MTHVQSMPRKRVAGRALSAVVPPTADYAKIAASRFGVTTFRPGQRELIEAVLAGHDALGVLPTGGGKSLCYELPALLLPGATVVVSPLIALMEDQCAHLTRARVDAARLDSTRTCREEHVLEAEIRHGEHPLIYVTPERLSTPECRAMLRARGVSLLVVDEAHCIAQWGHHFRPAFLRIAEAAEALGRPPILALTATARSDTAREIVEQLGLRNPTIVRRSIARPNLSFDVVRTVNEDAKREVLRSILARREPGIIYSATIAKTEELHASLLAEGYAVGRYHGQLKQRERVDQQRRFMSGETPVIVATKAFGLGVDNPNVRFVVHHEVPDSIESYYQEAGRAGRDGAPARATLLFRLEDKRTQSFFLGGRYPKRAEVSRLLSTLALVPQGVDLVDLARETKTPERRTVVAIADLQRDGVVQRHDGGRVQLRSPKFDRAEAQRLSESYDPRTVIDHTRLEAMMHYGTSTGCRDATLRAYFDEPTKEVCGRCDACDAQARA